MAQAAWILIFFLVISWSEAHSKPALLWCVQSNHPYSLSSENRELCAAVLWQFSNWGEQLGAVLPQKLLKKKRKLMSFCRRSRITTTAPYSKQMMLNFLGRTVKFTGSRWNNKWQQMRRKSANTGKKFLIQQVKDLPTESLKIHLESRNYCLQT